MMAKSYVFDRQFTFLNNIDHTCFCTSDGFISLNSFGYGGANGHVVLKPYKKKQSIRGEK